LKRPTSKDQRYPSGPEKATFPLVRLEKANSKNKNFLVRPEKANLAQ